MFVTFDMSFIDGIKINIISILSCDFMQDLDDCHHSLSVMVTVEDIKAGKDKCTLRTLDNVVGRTAIFVNNFGTPLHFRNCQDKFLDNTPIPFTMMNFPSKSSFPVAKHFLRKGKEVILTN